MQRFHLSIATLPLLTPPQPMPPAGIASLQKARRALTHLWIRPDALENLAPILGPMESALPARMIALVILSQMGRDVIYIGGEEIKIVEALRAALSSGLGDLGLTRAGLVGVASERFGVLDNVCIEGMRFARLIWRRRRGEAGAAWMTCAGACLWYCCSLRRCSCGL